MIQLVSGKNDAWVAPTTKTSEIPTVEVSNLLRDTIPFTFGNGTYSVLLEKKTTVGNTYVAIPLEVHEWFLDTDVGVLTFFGSTFSSAFSPSGTYDQVPYLSFYTYEGSKALTTFRRNITINDLTVTGTMTVGGTQSSNNANAPAAFVSISFQF